MHVFASNGLMSAVAYFLCNFNMSTPLSSGPANKGGKTSVPDIPRRSEYPWGYAAGLISALLALFQPQRYGDFPEEDRRQFALEEPELARTPLELNNAARDAILDVYLKCQAFLAGRNMALVSASVAIQLIGMVNAAALLGGQSCLGARVDWLVCTCMCFDNGRMVDLFTLYANIIQRRHTYIQLDDDAQALATRLINSLFLRLHHAVVKQDMVEAAQAGNQGINQSFRQMYTKLSQTCFNPACSVAVDLKVCSACLQAKYCSATCQMADWAAHRTICSFRPITVDA
jgi:hypothetical protein